MLGNGNPGSTSIDKRQNGSEEGIKKYNDANGTSYTFEAYPDGEFGELTELIQKWTAVFNEKGDDLVGGDRHRQSRRRSSRRCRNSA